MVRCVLVFFCLCFLVMSANTSSAQIVARDFTLEQVQEEIEKDRQRRLEGFQSKVVDEYCFGDTDCAKTHREQCYGNLTWAVRESRGSGIDLTQFISDNKDFSLYMKSVCKWIFDFDHASDSNNENYENARALAAASVVLDLHLYENRQGDSYALWLAAAVIDNIDLQLLWAHEDRRYLDRARTTLGFLKSEFGSSSVVEEVETKISLLYDLYEQSSLETPAITLKPKLTKVQFEEYFGSFGPYLFDLTYADTSQWRLDNMILSLIYLTYHRAYFNECGRESNERFENHDVLDARFDRSVSYGNKTINVYREIVSERVGVRQSHFSNYTDVASRLPDSFYNAWTDNGLGSDIPLVTYRSVLAGHEEKLMSALAGYYEAFGCRSSEALAMESQIREVAGLIVE